LIKLILKIKKYFLINHIFFNVFNIQVILFDFKTTL